MYEHELRLTLQNQSVAVLSATRNEIGKHFQSFLLRWSLLMKSFSQRAALKLTRFAKQQGVIY